jgi:hypothetical protein
LILNVNQPNLKSFALVMKPTLISTAANVLNKSVPPIATRLRSGIWPSIRTIERRVTFQNFASAMLGNPLSLKGQQVVEF